MSPIKSKTKKTTISKKAAKTPAGLELAVFNQEGKEVAKINLPEKIFGLKLNPSLVKQAYEAQMSQARIPYAHSKDRSEVRGGGKKPWRQKGTGRSRHGSIRSPIWRGGGATFGPRKDTVYAKNINKKMRRSALLMVLSGKVRDNEIVVLDDLKLEQPKTKLMADVVKNLNDVKNDLGKGALVVMAQKNENIIRATRNIPKFMTIGAQNLNVVDLLNHRYVLMPKSAIEIIEKTFTK
jgi:large subunit ribosomal protein L4